MFENATVFNQPLNEWDTSKVISMAQMFEDASSFNQPIGSWDTGNVETMMEMFQRVYYFDQDISSWDTSRVTDMNEMFYKAYEFSYPLDNWDVSKVEDMYYMFASASSFNESLGSWKTSGVTDMSGMFYNAYAFNQPLDSWDVSKVTSMRSMFNGAENFNQCLGSWAGKTSDDVDVSNMLDYTSCALGVGTPVASIGPWCQGEEDQCVTGSGPCDDGDGFTKKKVFITCDDLKAMKNRKKKNNCKRASAKKACPSVCEVKCTCKNSVKFKLQATGKKKYRCNKVEKPNQPTCSDKINNKLLVEDVCPKKCKTCYK